LFHSLALGRVGEYFWAICALAPFSLASMSSNTTPTFIALHPKLDGYFPFFLEDYKLDQDLKFLLNLFKLVFQCMLHLLASSHFGMVFEHFQDCFHPKNLMSGFL
jgi:hypothetical protein